MSTSAATAAATSATGDHLETEVPLSQTPGALEIRAVSYTGEEVGRGVFSLIDIPRGAFIENAHAILLPEDEYRAHIAKTVLEHYVYSAPRGSKHQGAMLLALGIGSLFNHSKIPNVDFRVLAEEQRVEYRACRDIKAGEELCIFYGTHVPWEKEEREARKRELEKQANEFAFPEFE